MSGTPSPAMQAVIDAGQEAFIQNYAPAPMVLDRGKGARIWDFDDNEYIDYRLGYGPAILGYADERVDAAARHGESRRLRRRLDFTRSPALNSRGPP